MTKLLNLAIIIGLLTATTVAAQTYRTPNKFTLTNDYVITVPVYLNNQGPFEFLFDTGSTTSAIEPSLAQQLKLTLSEGAVVITATGETKNKYSYLDEVSFGKAVVPKLACLISNLQELQRLNPRIRGVLGGNFLAHFNYLLDYKTKTVTFEENDELGAALYGFQLSAKFNANRNAVRTSVPHLNIQASLVLDSAIPSVIFFKRLESASSANSRVTTLNGTATASLVNLKTLVVGETTITNHQAAFVETDRNEDGLLPTRLFSSVYVNNKIGMIMLNPTFHPTAATRSGN